MKLVVANRRAKYDYDFDQKLTAGIALTGAEVKSIKAGHVSLKGSYVVVNRGELWLLNAHVSPYKFARPEQHEETRSKKLLVSKAEIKRLTAMKQNGMSFIPLAIGIERGLIKVEVGIGRGLKRIDKREVIKRRQAQRDIARENQPR